MTGFERAYGFAILAFVVTGCSESQQPTASRAPALALVELQPLTISFRSMELALNRALLHGAGQASVKDAILDQFRDGTRWMAAML
jgi:hypothetical protein